MSPLEPSQDSRNGADRRTVGTQLGEEAHPELRKCRHVRALDSGAIRFLYLRFKNRKSSFSCVRALPGKRGSISVLASESEVAAESVV